MNFADAHFGHEGGCGCCGFHASERLLNELSIRMTERAVLDWAGLEQVLRDETGDVPYVPHEVSLTALLAEHAAELADEVEPVLLGALSGNYIDADRVMVAGSAAGSIWAARAWPSTMEAKTGVLVNGAVLVGSNEIPFAPLLGDVDRLRIVNGMVRSARYATNNYFNTQVMPALVDAVNSAVLNGNANDLNELGVIREMLDRRLRSVPYWNVVANAAASRAYHYGYLHAGVAAGHEIVVFVATLDDRTTVICRTLHGLQWPAADVLLLANRVAEAEDTDEVRTITPWVRPVDITDWSPAGLLSRGIVIPPVHGRCRSRLRFI